MRASPPSVSGWRPWLAVGAVVALGTVTAPALKPVDRSVETATAAQAAPGTQAAPAPSGQVGHAVGVSLTSVLGNAALADTGDVDDPARSPVRRSVVDVALPFVSATVVVGAVVIPAVGSVEAQASVTGFRLNLLGTGGPSTTAAPAPLARAVQSLDLLSLTVDAVTATSQSTCADGSSAEARIGLMTVNGAPLLTVPVPAVNTRVAVPGLPLVSVVLNEQTPVDVAHGSGLAVNAIHVVVAGLLDLTLASARSTVSCRAPVAAPTLAVVPSVVPQGRVATARGAGFPASAPVVVTFDGPDIRPVKVISGSDGSVEFSVVVPHQATLGMRTVTASVADGAAKARFLLVRRSVEPPSSPFGEKPGG